MSDVVSQPFLNLYVIGKDFAPVIIALIAAIIAFFIQRRQWLTARDKLRREFMSEVEQLIDYAINIPISGDYDNPTVVRLYRKLEETRFLFGEDIIAFCNAIQEACELRFDGGNLRRDADPSVDASVWKASGSDIVEGRKRLRAYRAQLYRKFEPYFSLAHVR